MEILLVMAILPVYLIACYIYKKDPHKESRTMIKKLILSGMGSALLALAISILLSNYVPLIFDANKSSNMFELAIQIFFGIALLEEFCKWIFLYSIGYKSKDFDEVYDGIVFAVFVSLGFAAFENLLYIFGSDTPLTTAIVRMLLSVPSHAINGVFMGYYLGVAKYYGLNKNKKARNRNIALSILVPALLHFAYDYLVYGIQTDYTILFLLLFLGFIYLLYKNGLKTIDKISKENYLYKDQINSD
jgi:RsiW-degrading membrane proteinase PrsW (M82 family)